MTARRRQVPASPGPEPEESSMGYAPGSSRWGCRRRARPPALDISSAVRGARRNAARPADRSLGKQALRAAQAAIARAPRAPPTRVGVHDAFLDGYARPRRDAGRPSHQAGEAAARRSLLRPSPALHGFLHRADGRGCAVAARCRRDRAASTRGGAEGGAALSHLFGGHERVARDALAGSGRGRRARARQNRSVRRRDGWLDHVDAVTSAVNGTAPGRSTYSPATAPASRVARKPTSDLELTAVLNRGGREGAVEQARGRTR